MALANVESLYRTVTELLQRFGYKKEAKFPHKYGGYFRNDADHRDFVGIGTAAGQSILLVVLCQAYMCPYVCHSPLLITPMLFYSWCNV